MFASPCVIKQNTQIHKYFKWKIISTVSETADVHKYVSVKYLLFFSLRNTFEYLYSNNYEKRSEIIFCFISSDVLRSDYHP